MSWMFFKATVSVVNSSATYSLDYGFQGMPFVVVSQDQATFDVAYNGIPLTYFGA